MACVCEFRLKGRWRGSLCSRRQQLLGTASPAVRLARVARRAIPWLGPCDLTVFAGRAEQLHGYGSLDLDGFDQTKSALGFFMDDKWVALENPDQRVG